MTSEELKGLAGGKKQMWIREHRDLIMQYCETFGPDATCEQFQLQRETLDRLYSRSNKQVPFGKAEKALLLAQIAKEASNELRHEVRQLRQEFSEFQTSVAGQVANKILVPWIQSAIQLSEELEINNNLDSPTSLRDLRLSSGNKKGDFRFK